MKFRRNRQRENVDINLASLIDVVFVLLLFFVVTTTFTRETQLRVELPEAASAEHGLGRAAAPLPVGALVGPQLQRHRDHLRAALALEQRRHGRVHAPAEGDEDALAGGRGRQGVATPARPSGHEGIAAQARSRRR